MNDGRRQNSIGGGAVFEMPTEPQKMPESENKVWEQPKIGEESPNTVRRLAEIERKEREGIFSELSPEMDLTGNGEVSASEEMIFIDGLKDAGLEAPSSINFNDKGQEKLSDETVAAVETAIREAGDDMAALNTKVNDLGQTFLLHAYGRHRGDGLKI